jgi:tRNA dimethylallyltransferase
MQVYKGMEVLSQAPGRPERKGARHHLVGILSPKKEYSAAIFRKRCERIIAGIIKRKKLPIVVGGSGLYVKALVDGLFPSPPADIKFRGKMNNLAARHGSGYLHERLKGIDPESARAVHPNDTRRIIRALEIYDSTGRTMTELKAATRGIKEKYDIKIFGLTRPRAEIYSAINSRVERMFEYGAVREAAALRKKRLSKTAQAVLGFKEICGYLEGRYGADEAKELLKINTRRFAKRQLTWFRADVRIKWFDMGKTSAATAMDSIAKAVKKGR